MEYDEQYWKDYTAFINEAEKISKLGPANLFDHYSNLVVELEKSTFFEWVYEEEAEATVKQIHDLIRSESMRNNILRDLFALKVYDLDRRMEKFIKMEFTKDQLWIKDFKLEMVEWNG